MVTVCVRECVCVCVNELTCLVHLLSPAGRAEIESDAVNIWRRLHWALLHLSHPSLLHFCPLIPYFLTSPPSLHLLSSCSSPSSLLSQSPHPSIWPLSRLISLFQWCVLRLPSCPLFFSSSPLSPHFLLSTIFSYSCPLLLLLHLFSISLFFFHHLVFIRPFPILF